MNSKQPKGLNARKLLMSRYETIWYEVEQNTCALLKAVVAYRSPAKLSGDDIWNLIRLTWINASQSEPVDNHWMYLKVPALAALFNADMPALDSIESAIEAMSLPVAVAHAAVASTGMINFYTAYRYSCQSWCRKNQGALREIIQRAMELGPNDQERLDLAAAIDALGRIPSPNKKRKMGAVAAITPVVAGLDPSCRFPIITARHPFRVYCIDYSSNTAGSNRRSKAS